MLSRMLRLWVVLLLSSSAALAQVDEYALPAFGAPDAGVEAPVPSLSPPPLVPPEKVAPPRPPPAPTWARGGGGVTLLFTGLRDYALMGEISLMGTVLGTPTASREVPGEVEGWLLQVGAQGDFGRAGGPLCRGTVLCASRGAGGLTAKGGWARGLPGVTDGAARTQTYYFAQADVLLSRFDIASAPLSPGARTWELLLRLRLGLHFSLDSRVTRTGVTLLAAAVFEGIPVSSGTQGVSLGGCLGLGF